MVLTLVPILILWAVSAAETAYADVPDGALGEEVLKAVDYGLMNGYSHSVFGYANPMTRAQFVAVLDRLFPFDSHDAAADTDDDQFSAENADNPPLPAAMDLPKTMSASHRAALAHAVIRGVASDSEPFRPDEAVTREEMAEMLVKALGLNDAALALSGPNPAKSSDAENASPFQDLPEGKEGYASIAYAIGMTKGTSDRSFSPDAPATRAQVAAMLVRVYEKLYQETDFLHGFYVAPDAQSDLEQSFDVVSAGWSRMTWNAARAVLETTTSDGQDGYGVPSDYAAIVKALRERGAKVYLTVFMDASGGASELLASETGRARAAELILRELTISYPELGENPYDGVTVDFEGLREPQKVFFVDFLSELRTALAPTGKGLYVCVPPYLSYGPWFDGYDCRAIAEIADKLILTVYDNRNLNNFLGSKAYRNAPPSSVSGVYLSLLKLKEEVADASKIVLNIRLQSAAWETDERGNLISGALTSPDTETILQGLRQSDAQSEWSFEHQTPYAVYRAPDGSRRFVWYENAESVQSKLQIARLLGVTGVSFWRVGLIPS